MFIVSLSKFSDQFENFPFFINLEPHTDARHKANLAGGTFFLLYELGGTGETPVKRDADVGSELAPDFVPEAESQLDIVQSSSGGELFDPLKRGVGLEARLEDQPLRQKIISGDSKTSRNVAALTDEYGRLDLMTIRCEAFQSDDPMRARDPAIPKCLRLSACADLKIIVLPNQTPIEELEVDIVIGFECGVALSFALEPEAVVIAAVPTLDVPPEVSIRSFRAVFEHIGKNEGEPFQVIDRTGPILLWRQVRWGGLLAAGKVLICRCA